MDDMLPLDAEPYDPRCPISGFDERPCQLIGEIRAPMPLQPGRSPRQDDDDTRQGTGWVGLAFAPGRSWRGVQVRARRTAVDSARFRKPRVKQYDPIIKRIRLVQDNWHTPTPGSLYAALPPQEACAFAQKFARHYTPVKGRGLQMAEIAGAALSKQGLERSLGDIDTLAQESAAWNDTRKRVRKTVRWKFTTTDARRKLHNKYPVGQD
jgi:hypothetical protein